MQAPTLTPDDHHLLTRVRRRILPLLILLYLIAYLDRINLGFAATAMQRDLRLSDALYGAGAGLFFVGTLTFQVPANLLLARFGARRTLSAMMVLWGCVSASMVLVHTAPVFLTLRFLLGAAEAGFYPGVILYLTLWLPRSARNSATAWFLFAIPLASIFGGPLSTWLLAHGSHGPLRDWQALLLTEALPAILVGASLPVFMTDSPREARWLSPAERDRLLALNTEVQTRAAGTGRFDPGPLPHLARFAALYFAMQVALYAQSFWLPKLLESLSRGGATLPATRVGWLVSVVYILAAAGMLLWGYISDRMRSSRLALAIPLLVAAAGYAFTTFANATQHLDAALAILILGFGAGAAGALAATPPFWSEVTLGQRPAALAGMIALINALGNLGGFAGPTILGILREHTASYTTGMLVAAAGVLFAAILALTRRAPDPAT